MNRPVAFLLIFYGNEPIFIILAAAEDISSGVAKYEDFPYAVAIKDSNRNFVCTGAIIAARSVITAAHCSQ